MFGMGLSEIIFIAILALVFIGPKQLPEVARSLGRFLNELKRTTSDLTDELKAHTRIDITGPAPKKPTPPIHDTSDGHDQDGPIQQEFTGNESGENIKNTEDKKKTDS